MTYVTTIPANIKCDVRTALQLSVSSAEIVDADDMFGFTFNQYDKISVLLDSDEKDVLLWMLYCDGNEWVVEKMVVGFEEPPEVETFATVEMATRYMVGDVVFSNIL